MPPARYWTSGWLSPKGTVAGLGAGFYARHASRLEGVIMPTKRLELWQDGSLRDIALVDIAVSDRQFVGARELWEVDHLRELFLTQGLPHSIGLSSIGGWIKPVTPHNHEGLHVTLGRMVCRCRVRQGEQWEVMLTWDGPRILDVEYTLREAQRQGL